MINNPLICIAACTGAFGVRGEVKIRSFTDIPETCFAYRSLRDENGDICLTVTKHWPVKGGFAATCKEVTTHEQAEGLKSKKLYVYRSELPEPDEDEFYYEDLTGLEVRTETGAVTGFIRAVHDFGSGDILEIAGGIGAQGENIPAFFHPFTKKAVPEVNLIDGYVRIILSADAQTD